MPFELESPNGSVADWERLYLARGGAELVDERPIFTGDIFEQVTVRSPRGEEKRKTVLVLQHPCAIRTDGVELRESLLVAEVRRWPLLAPEKWNTSGKIMPLPSLLPDVTSSRTHQAAVFDSTFHADAADLMKRIACLSLRGVNLLVQRWVYHCSRAVIPSWNFNDVIAPAYEETDIIEEWAITACAAGRSVAEAWADASAWLSMEAGGRTRRKALDDPQQRSTIRREARAVAETWQQPIAEAEDTPTAA